MIVSDKNYYYLCNVIKSKIYGYNSNRIKTIMQEHGNIQVTSYEKNLLSITYNKEADKFFINS